MIDKVFLIRCFSWNNGQPQLFAIHSLLWKFLVIGLLGIVRNSPASSITCRTASFWNSHTVIVRVTVYIYWLLHYKLWAAAGECLPNVNYNINPTQSTNSEVSGIPKQVPNVLLKLSQIFKERCGRPWFWWSSGQIYIHVYGCW